MTQREDKQRARTSREELGKFFYNLAAMCFGTTVLGSGMALVTDTGNPERLLGMFVGGVVGTVALGQRQTAFPPATFAATFSQYW